MMNMAVTISTHNGSAVRREHNIRNPKVVDKEEHIRKDGIHETWYDEPVRDAYERIFGDAVRTYNENQSRPERKIDSYYKKITEDKKKHVAYEMIIGIYGDDCSDELGKEIMKKFVETWKNGDLNHHLQIIGAYYHADEEGKPHVHIDYIPVAKGYKNGMQMQNGLSKALSQAGFVKLPGEPVTPQIKWERSMNDLLTLMCESKGLTVEHPRIEKIKHLHTDEYKLKSKLADTEKEINSKIAEIAKNEEKADELNKKIADSEHNLKVINKKYDVTAKEMEKVLNKKARASEIRRSIFDRDVQSYHANMLEETRKIGNDAYEYMTQAKAEREKAQVMLMTAENKEKEIAPLHQNALNQLARARAEQEKAKKLRESIEYEITSKAQELADEKIEKILQGSPASETKRMRDYMDSLKFSDGSTALERFDKQEEEFYEKLNQSKANPKQHKSRGMER